MIWEVLREGAEQSHRLAGSSDLYANTSAWSSARSMRTGQRRPVCTRANPGSDKEGPPPLRRKYAAVRAVKLRLSGPGGIVLRHSQC
jgi:hypothetical protein